jgi:hypothetical protein
MQKPKELSLSWQNIVWVYLTLTAAVLLSWLPLLRRTLLVADDFFVVRMISSSTHLLPDGPWRPLGILPYWLFSANPAYPPVLTLLTHLLSTVLLFHVCQSLFHGIRLPLTAALVFAMFPFGYQAMAWMSAYNFVIPVVFFLANILLLSSPQAQSRWPLPAMFALSSLLALLTCFSNECLFFAVAFSGFFVFIGAPPDAFRSFKAFVLAAGNRGLLAMAPPAGSLVWAVLYHAFKGPSPTKTITRIHLISILSVYFRQYSLLDVFGPWFSPVTRSLVFFSWSWITAAVVLCGAAVFLAGLYRLSNDAGARDSTTPANLPLLVAIVALLAGGSLIYVLGGGFSWDSRKKYPLVPLMLLLVCWLWRAGFTKVRLTSSGYLAAATTMCVVAAMTTWMVVGIWKYESRRYNDLGEFIAAQKIQGNIDVQWDPDLYRAWPNLERSLGWRFDNTLWLNYAAEYRGGGEIDVAPSGTETVILYDPRTDRWILSSRKVLALAK